MPDYSRIIRMAYLRILDREPDSGGLAHYNERMNAGTTEAAMREALLRSAEYADKNPSVTGRAAARVHRSRRDQTPAGGRARVTRRKAR